MKLYFYKKDLRGSSSSPSFLPFLSLFFSGKMGKGQKVRDHLGKIVPLMNASGSWGLSMLFCVRLQTSV